jgi:hypothetical protein
MFVMCIVPSIMGTIQEFLLYVEQFRYPVGLLARQRKGELARLNDQLRQINAALRRQAKIESYAPTLSYAPVGSKVHESDVVVDPRKERLIAYLRSGKNQLRNQTPDKAFPEFKAAFDLAQSLSCGAAPTADAGKISNILPISNICTIGNIFPISNI